MYFIVWKLTEISGVKLCLKTRLLLCSFLVANARELYGENSAKHELLKSQSFGDDEDWPRNVWVSIKASKSYDCGWELKDEV